MEAGKIVGANWELKPPKDWDESKTGVKCDSLHVKVERPTEYSMKISSAWKPSPEELAALNDGASVVLMVYGTSHPAVSLTVERQENQNGNG